MGFKLEGKELKLIRGVQEKAFATSQTLATQTKSRKHPTVIDGFTPYPHCHNIIRFC